MNTKDFTPIKAAFTQLLPENQFLKEVGFAVQALAINPKLQECSQESILKAVYNLSLTGLTLNPLDKLAYLTPRWNNAKRINECLLMPSYIGMSKLAMEAGNLQKIEARIVYEGDVFEVEYEPNTQIIHKPKFQSKEMQCVYAVATLANGVKQFEVMTKSEIFEIRAMSDSWKALESGKVNSAIWKEHEGEMCKKTVIKRLTKYLPKGNNTKAIEQLNQAVHLDNVDYMATDGQLFRIESLIASSSFDESHRQQIEYALGNGQLTKEQADNIIASLENNQLNPIKERGIVSNKSIHKELSRHEQE